MVRVRVMVMVRVRVRVMVMVMVMVMVRVGNSGNKRTSSVQIFIGIRTPWTIYL